MVSPHSFLKGREQEAIIITMVRSNVKRKVGFLKVFLVVQGTVESHFAYDIRLLGESSHERCRDSRKETLRRDWRFGDGFEPSILASPRPSYRGIKSELMVFLSTNALYSLH